MNEASRIGLEAIPTDQQVEHGHRKSQASLKVIPNAMHDLLDSAEQFGDKIFRGHEVSPFADRLAAYSLEDLMTFCN